MSNNLHIQVALRSWGSKDDPPRRAVLEGPITGIKEAVCVYLDKTDLPPSPVKIGDFKPTPRGMAAMQLVATLLDVHQTINDMYRSTAGGVGQGAFLYICDEHDASNAVVQLRFFLVSKMVVGTMVEAFNTAINKALFAESATDDADGEGENGGGGKKKKFVPAKKGRRANALPDNTSASAAAAQAIAMAAPGSARLVDFHTPRSFYEWTRVLSAYLKCEVTDEESVAQVKFRDTNHVICPLKGLNPHQSFVAYHTTTQSIIDVKGSLTHYFSGNPDVGIVLRLPEDGGSVWVMPEIAKQGIGNLMEMSMPRYEHDHHSKFLEQQFEENEQGRAGQFSRAAGALGRMVGDEENELLRKIDKAEHEAALSIFRVGISADEGLNLPVVSCAMQSTLLHTVGLATADQVVTQEWEPTTFYTLRTFNKRLWDEKVAPVRDPIKRATVIQAYRRETMQSFVSMVRPGVSRVVSGGAKRVLDGWFGLIQKGDSVTKLMTLPILDAKFDVASNWCAWFLQQLTDSVKVACAHFEILLARITAFDASRQDNNILRPNIVFFSTACMSKSFAIRVIEKSSFMCEKSDYESRLNLMADHVQDNCVVTCEEFSFKSMELDAGKLAIEKNKRTNTVFLASRLGRDPITGRMTQQTSLILHDEVAIFATNEPITNIHGPLADRFMFVAMHPMRRLFGDIDTMKAQDELEGSSKAQQFYTMCQVLECQLFMFNNMLFTGTLRVPPTLTVARECIRRIKNHLVSKGLREPSTRDVDRWLVYVRTFALIEAMLSVYWNPENVRYYQQLHDLTGMSMVEARAVARPHHVVLAGSLLRNQLYDRRADVLLTLVAYKAFKLAPIGKTPYAEESLVTRNAPRNTRRNEVQGVLQGKRNGMNGGTNQPSPQSNPNPTTEGGEEDNKNYDWIEFGLDKETLVQQLSQLATSRTSEPLTLLDVDHLLHVLSTMTCKTKSYHKPRAAQRPVIDERSMEEDRPLVRFVSTTPYVKRVLFNAARLDKEYKDVVSDKFDMKALSVQKFTDPLEEAFEMIQDKYTRAQKVANLQPLSPRMCHLAKTIYMDQFDPKKKDARNRPILRTEHLYIQNPAVESASTNADVDGAAASIGYSQVPPLPDLITGSEDFGDLGLRIHFTRLEEGVLPRKFISDWNPHEIVHRLVTSEETKGLYPPNIMEMNYPKTQEEKYENYFKLMEEKIKQKNWDCAVTEAALTRRNPNAPNSITLSRLDHKTTQAEMVNTLVQDASVIQDSLTNHATEKEDANHFAMAIAKVASVTHQHLNVATSKGKRTHNVHAEWEAVFGDNEENTPPPPPSKTARTHQQRQPSPITPTTDSGFSEDVINSDDDDNNSNVPFFLTTFATP